MANNLFVELLLFPELYKSYDFFYGCCCCCFWSIYVLILYDINAISSEFNHYYFIVLLLRFMPLFISEVSSTPLIPSISLVSFPHVIFLQLWSIFLFSHIFFVQYFGNWRFQCYFLSKKVSFVLLFLLVIADWCLMVH